MQVRPKKELITLPAGGGRPRLSAVHLAQFPFTSTLSLEPLLDYWRQEETLPAALRREVEEYVSRHPELTGPLASPAELDPHREFLDLLMLPLFPSAYAAVEPAAALVPFEYRSVYSTPAFQRLFTQGGGMISGRVNLDLRTFTYGRIVSAYFFILRTIYGIDIPFEYPVTFTIRDPDTGLDRHYKIATDLSFVRIRQTKRLPPLSDDVARGLLTNLSDLSSWSGIIPPDSFEFTGFTVIRAYDVTDEQVLSLMERDLISEGSLAARKLLPDIEDHMRTLLRTPHLELGLSVIDGNDFYLLNEPSQPLVDTFFTRSARYDISALLGSVFQRCLDQDSLQIVEDLAEMRNRAPIEDDLLRWGVRTVVAAPLHLERVRVGVLYLWSPTPSSLGSINVLKLMDVLPIFAAAVNRARDEMRNRVQDVIMGKYTAIHPSVEWRFRQAAMNFLQKHEQGQMNDVEPIVFEQVHPLFAATDIRGSSDHRNEAVRLDLLQHLELAKDVVRCARDDRPLAIFYHLLERISRYEAALNLGLSSGDEAEVREFLRTSVEPILLHLDGFGNKLDECLTQYREAVNSESETLYTRSRAFELGVQLVNETISDFLDAEQEKVQRFFPHYFEKHQTDGVEFSMYVGGSLLEGNSFDPLSVRVLRLWQLMVMCGIAVRMEPLKRSLEDRLETTHLILVQNAPINIRYRFDETRFDVDGPHHVRFEIMKQRVEKAFIKETQERLTQPDRIAVVYSQEREAEEYWSYIDYLQERGFVSQHIEDLELEDLPGMKGLRALRIGVAARTAAELPEIQPADLLDAVQSLTS